MTICQRLNDLIQFIEGLERPGAHFLFVEQFSSL